MEYVPIPSHTQREKEKTQRYNVIQYVKFVKIKNFIFNAYIKKKFWKDCVNGPYFYL